MLSKGRRISRRLFPTDPHTGIVFHVPHASLRVVTGTTTTTRVSVVAAKHAIAAATDRHLLKRRVYDAVARSEKGAPLPPALYVFFVKKGAQAISYADLRAEVEVLLEKAREAIVKAPRLV